jgi:hypothetical protein
VALLDDIGTFLCAATSGFTLNAGTSGTGNLMKGQMTDNAKTPDTVVALYETAGWAPQWVFSTGSTSPAYETAGLQVISRSTSYQTARDYAYRAYRILDYVAGQALPTDTGTPYYRIAAVGPPFAIGQDGNSRFLLSCNFDVLKARAS